MNDALNTPSPHDLALLSAVVRQVARRHRLPAHDADDFAQSVHLRLLERHYDLFHRFTGGSSLRTYLTTAVTRLLLDWRNATYGKWRPSAWAVRTGHTAIALDRLINRDGYTAGEAVEHLRTTTAEPVAHLELLADHLPRRSRRRMVPLDDACHMPAPGADETSMARQARRNVVRGRRIVATTLRQLSPEDRQLLRARYLQGASVQMIARRLAVDPGALYRRCDRVLRTLRQRLASDGVTELRQIVL